MAKVSVGIVGGGLLGLSISHLLQSKRKDVLVSLYEKESAICEHQSGNNSGVLHCGLYYKPGSLKAKLAVTGIREMISFCRKHNIAHEVCGKVVVSSSELESKRLLDLAKRGEENGLKGLKLLSKEDLRLREPYVRADTSLLVPEEGIVDFKGVGNKLLQLIKEDGGEVFLSHKVLSVREQSNSELVLLTDKGEYSHDFLIFCGGLFSDRLYKASTNSGIDSRIIPFRGEYYSLNESGASLLNHLIYPVPDPQFPFLGVHFTRMINGEKEVGPNAVLAFKREGYKLSDFSLYDTFDSLSFRGLHKFIQKYFLFSMGELGSSLSKNNFLKKAKKMIPDISLEHLGKGTAGVRAQSMSKEGELMMDFLIKKEGRQIHVLNAPSPGATSSLAIADYVLEEYF